MTSHRTRTAAIALAAGLSAVCFSSNRPLPAAASAPAPTGTAVLGFDVLPGLDHLTVVGAPSSAQRIDIAIALSRPNMAGERALMHDLYDPSSPMYRQFIDVNTFASRFGVDPAQSAGVTAWLSSGGLQVGHVSPARDTILAQGTMAQVEALFHVTERLYLSTQGRVFFANDVAPTIPAGAPIITVTGLNSWQHAATTRRTTGTATAGCSGSSCPVQAEDLWSIYDLPAQNRGKGQSIAILGEGVLGSETHTGDVLNDLRLYEDEHHFPHIPITVVCVMMGDCGTDTSGSGEWDLDQAASTGMAPDADHLTYYFAKDLSDTGQIAMINEWLQDPQGALQANASFSECEAGPYNNLIYGVPGNVDGGSGVPSPIAGFGPTVIQLGDNMEAAVEPTLWAGALMGKTLFAAAGDTGPGCDVPVALGFGPNGLAPSPYPANPYPAGATYAVAAGGTTLTPDSSNSGKRGSEVVWNFTGAGSSPFLVAPTYQKNVPNLTGTCIIGPNGETTSNGQLCRGVPDVAAMSTGAGGYAMVSGGSDSTNGGTSLSSPLLVGMWTRIQAASGSPHGIGFANFTFYALGKNPTTYARDFYDITSGSAGPGLNCPGTTPPQCSAQVGWDYASGWGVPDVANIILDTRSSPGPVVPEAPIAPLLVLIGAAVAVLTVRRVRRT
jgi:subtilase family serine protease